MQNLQEFIKPNNLDEAAEVLAGGEGNHQPLAGGTGVSITNSKNLEGLVDLSTLGLDYVESEQGSLKIGAMATMNQLEENPAVQDFAGGIISECASHVGTTPLRNMITIGGNITQLRVWSDLPAVLMALEAEIHVTGEEIENSYPAEKFFETHPTRLLSDSDLVVAIQFPAELAEYRGAYNKFSKTEDGYAAVSVSAAVDLDRNTINDVNLGVGSASPSPTRCPEAEAELAGEKLTEATAARAAEICRENVRTTSNVWGSAEYKEILVEKYVKRTLLDVNEQ